MTNDLLIIYGENICAFPQIHVLGSPTSYMTLHLIPSKYEENKVFFCISVATGIPKYAIAMGLNKHMLEVIMVDSARDPGFFSIYFQQSMPTTEQR